MNIQSVNVKTATKGSTEISVENCLAKAISEQKNLLTYLADLKNRHMSEIEREEIVWGTLMLMAENILFPGVVDWHADVLQVHFSVAQPWLQAQKLVELLYGDTGKEAWESSRKHIADSMRAEPYMP